MKKFLVSMMAVITAVLLVACSNASNKDLVHVGVLQYVEHPSLSATRKRFIEELKEEGYVDGKNIKIDYQNAQGDQSNLQTFRLKKPRNTSRKLVLKRLSKEFHQPMISKTQPRA